MAAVKGGSMDFDDFDEADPEERAFLVRRFRTPGGRSALHPGRRSFPCPTCERPNALTAADKAAGYQCDRCADRDEGGGY